MGGNRKKHVSHHFKQKHPKNRRNKTVLVFDEDARKEYLTGFQKRKKERQKRAQEQEIERLKEEKKQLKIKKKAELFERKYDSPAVEEVKHLVKAAVVDLPNHTVTISGLDSSTSGLMLGVNDEDEPDEEADEGEIEENQEAVPGDVGENDSDEEVKEPSVVSHKKKRVFKVKWKRHRNFSHLNNKKHRQQKKKDVSHARGAIRKARKYSNKK